MWFVGRLLERRNGWSGGHALDADNTAVKALIIPEQLWLRMKVVYRAPLMAPSGDPGSSVL